MAKMIFRTVPDPVTYNGFSLQSLGIEVAESPGPVLEESTHPYLHSVLALEDADTGIHVFLHQTQGHEPM